jgi:cell division protein FtsN
MTRMAENDEQDLETYDEEAPRSIFSALWFRALVVVLVLGVVADVMTAPAAKSTAALRPPASPPPAAAPPQPTAPVQVASPATPSAPTPAAAPPRAEPPKTAVPKPEAPKAEPPKSEARKPEAARPVPAKPESPKTVAAKPAGPPKVAEAPKATEPAKSSEPAEPPRVAVAPPAPREVLAPRPVPSATAGAPYWVQVGAFKDEATAKRLAGKLREQNFSVEHSIRTRGAAAAPATTTMGGDRYNVFVSGLAPSELNMKLAAKGLTAQPVAGGVMVTPSMPLREAVTLSKDLAGDGLRVQVRRVTGGAGSGPSPSASPPSGSETVHRVRVGGFADRAAAVAAAKELEAKGFKVYIARGNQ